MTTQGSRAPVSPSDPAKPLADELRLLGRLIGTDSPQGRAEARGIVERAERETATLVGSLANLIDLCEHVFVKPKECDDLIAARAALAAADGTPARKAAETGPRVAVTYDVNGNSDGATYDTRERAAVRVADWIRGIPADEIGTNYRVRVELLAEEADHEPVPATRRPGDAAAVYAAETGCDYGTALRACNMD